MNPTLPALMPIGENALYVTPNIPAYDRVPLGCVPHCDLGLWAVLLVLSFVVIGFGCLARSQAKRAGEAERELAFLRAR